MDLFTRIAKRNYVSRGGGAGQDHADEMMERDMTGADRDPQLRAMELEAEIRNNAVEVWWLRGLVVLLLALWVVGF